ncbi:MAG: regulatory protein [Actinomycetia bacterium]|nr:regulatory protein [Actinomycetes bacterium]
MSHTAATVPRPTRALIVDDDDDVRVLVHLIIDMADNGVEVVAEASSAAEGLDRWREERPEVIVLDDQMPGGTGLAMAETILAECPSQRVILFSASLDERTVTRAEGLGVYACLAKDRVAELPDVILASAPAA